VAKKSDLTCELKNDWEYCVQLSYSKLFLLLVIVVVVVVVVVVLCCVVLWLLLIIVVVVIVVIAKVLAMVVEIYLNIKNMLFFCITLNFFIIFFFQMLRRVRQQNTI